MRSDWLILSPRDKEKQEGTHYSAGTLSIMWNHCWTLCGTRLFPQLLLGVDQRGIRMTSNVSSCIERPQCRELVFVGRNCYQTYSTWLLTPSYLSPVQGRRILCQCWNTPGHLDNQAPFIKPYLMTPWVLWWPFSASLPRISRCAYFPCRDQKFR